MGKSLSLYEFKNLVKTNNPFKADYIDMDNGFMKIHRCNIDKYLEKYACRDEEDLSDTLWYSYGCLVTVID